MKHSSRILAIILAALMLFSTVAAAAYTPKHEDEAEALKEMGLFLGTNAGFELDRAPNRAEALVMLIRLLGKEAEAKKCTAETPLKDVEGKWMESYVAWAYTSGITKGVSDTEFDYAGEANAKMFITFVLRALGYSDANGDFTYNESVVKAAELGLIGSGEYVSGTFYRDDCVAVSYTALDMLLKGSDQRLIDKLVAEGAVSESAAEKCGFIKSESEAGSEPAAEGTRVYFTMVVDGDIKLKAQPVTVNGEEATVEDVIREAHKLYYSDGEAGFAAGTDPAYGVYLINTIWGLKGNPLVILNSAPLSAGENVTNPFANVSKVMNGDNVVVNLNTNFMNPKPVAAIAVSVDGDNAELTVIKWTLQMDFTFKTSPMTDCVLYDGNGNEIGRTDADGKATVKAEGIVCADNYAAVCIDKNAEREAAVVDLSGMVVESKQPVAGEADYVIACVGDSLTYGMGTTDPEEQSYPALLTKKDGAYLLATERYGHSGATVDNGFLAYTGTDEYRASLKTEADIVLFMLGTNDTMFSQDLNSFPQTYRALLDTYANLPCQPRIIIMLPPHFFDTNTEDVADVNLETVIGYEKEIAAELGIPTIDVYSLTENKPEWSADGVHFTPEGYEIMADFVYGELCTILDSWN